MAAPSDAQISAAMDAIKTVSASYDAVKNRINANKSQIDTLQAAVDADVATLPALRQQMTDARATLKGLL